MFSLFGKKATSSTSLASMKGYKVSLNSNRSKRYGIAANSLEMLKQKIISKLSLESFKLFLSDGSLIDDEDYFQSIAAQSLIIIAENDEEVKTGESTFDSRNFLFQFCSFKICN